MSQAPIYVNKTIVLEDAIKIGYGGRPKSTKPIFNVILDRFFLACLVPPWVITTMCDSLLQLLNTWWFLLVQRSRGTRSHIGGA